MIAIHESTGTFSDRWIEFCRQNSIPHVVVNMYADDFFSVLAERKISVLLAHPQMADKAAITSSHAIFYAAEARGIKVFPGFNEFWHFDDKVAQKYIFEALGISTPKTHVFLSKAEAEEWLDNATYPIVFKLKAGAGSINVSLLKTRSDALRKVSLMFGVGVSATGAATADLITKARNHRARRDWGATLKRLPSTLKRWYRLRKSIDWERGYVYFQEFIKNNDHDTRVVIIGDRAFAFRRMVRPGDFRASGSGVISHDPDLIDMDMVKYAFEVAEKLSSKCIAFDFIKNGADGKPLVVEMSFGFMPDVVYQCPGHWDSKLLWRSGHMYPQDAILLDLIK